MQQSPFRMMVKRKPIWFPGSLEGFQEKVASENQEVNTCQPPNRREPSGQSFVESSLEPEPPAVLAKSPLLMGRCTGPAQPETPKPGHKALLGRAWGTALPCTVALGCYYNPQWISVTTPSLFQGCKPTGSWFSEGSVVSHLPSMATLKIWGRECLVGP